MRHACAVPRGRLRGGGLPEAGPPLRHQRPAEGAGARLPVRSYYLCIVLLLTIIIHYVLSLFIMYYYSLCIIIITIFITISIIITIRIVIILCYKV